jgi:hypothetical protein
MGHSHLGLAPTAAERLQLRDRLDREVQEAATRRQADEERLATVQNARPPEFDAAAQTAEGLKARVVELAGEHEAAVGLVAALGERVRVQEEAQARLGERAAAHKQAQREADLWRRLAGLIGLNEGEAFQKMALVTYVWVVPPPNPNAVERCQFVMS